MPSLLLLGPSGACGLAAICLAAEVTRCAEDLADPLSTMVPGAASTDGLGEVALHPRVSRPIFGFQVRIRTPSSPWQHWLRFSAAGVRLSVCSAPVGQTKLHVKADQGPFTFFCLWNLPLHSQRQCMRHAACLCCEGGVCARQLRCQLYPGGRLNMTGRSPQQGLKEAHSSGDWADFCMLKGSLVALAAWQRKGVFWWPSDSLWRHGTRCGTPRQGRA